jgi:hypothetical protein
LKVLEEALQDIGMSKDFLNRTAVTQNKQKLTNGIVSNSKASTQQKKQSTE